jgi:GxxExxY protein
MTDIRKLDELVSDNRLINRDETYAIIGAAMDVYYKLGCGFAEPVYQEALQLELGLRHIPFAAQGKLHVKYKDFVLKKYYRADFVCFEKVIVEIKAQTR